MEQISWLIRETLEKNRLSLHALNTDHIDEELLSAASISLYNDITKTSSHSGHRTDSKQGNEFQMNRFSGSAYVPMQFVECPLY